jgi:hypothetical protein
MFMKIVDEETSTKIDRKFSRQETAPQTPSHKDYRPDVTQTENDSDYHGEDDDSPAGPEDYEDEYENGMQDRKKKKKK